MKKDASLLILLFFTALNAPSVIPDPQPGADADPQQHQFTQIDSNHDGYISYNEFLTWHSHWLEWKFQHMDSDGDGYLSGDEFHTIDQKGKSEMIQREEVGQGVPLN